MEKRLSRSSERITIVLTVAFVLGVVLVWIFSDSSPYFPTLVMFLIWNIRLIASQSCPCCGKWTQRSLHWSKPDAGYCRHCGKLMEYDDTVAERERRRALKKD